MMSLSKQNRVFRLNFAEPWQVKAKSVLGCMRQSRGSRSGEEILLCSALLRPHGWFYVVLVFPIPGGCGISGVRTAQGHGDEGRLRELELSSLESRRLRGILSLCKNS